MTTIRLIPLLAGAAALVGMLGLAGPADALEKCKANIKTNDGTIEVQAKDVQGPLMWGNESGQETETFFNAGTCIDGDKAKKCVFGAEGTVTRITPPPGCTVFLDDGAGPPCSAYVKKCTPGLRESEPPAAVLAAQIAANTARIEVLEVLHCADFGGAIVGGACWFLGASEESCTTACGNAGLTYDEATRTFAGDIGTDANCNQVLDAVGAGGSGVTAVTCFDAGCHVLLSNNRFRCTTGATTADATANQTLRACACK